MNNITMSKDGVVSAKMAEAYITINGRRYNFMQLIDFEGKVDKKKGTIPILGRMMEGNKAYGLTGTFSATAHYNQSIVRQTLAAFKDTGKDVYFEIQITNDDPTSSVGRQTIFYNDCNTDGGILSKVDANGEYLDEEISGTFEDFSMPEAFAELAGM